MSYVQLALRSPIGSLESAARWTTASKPTRSATLDVADVPFESRGPLHGRPEVAAAVEVRIEAGDVVAGRSHQGRENRSDVPVMSRHEAPSSQLLTGTFRAKNASA